MHHLNKVLDELLAREGGFVNHPDDKGGPTNHGITQATLSGFLGRPATIDEIRNLTADVARNIYLQLYYYRPHLDLLTNDAVAAQVLDFGVNSGPATAVQHLQRMVGAKDDGALGPLTAAAVAQFINLYGVRTTIGLYLALRLRFLAKIVQKNPTQRTFAAGWMNRVAEMLERGMLWWSTTTS